MDTKKYIIEIPDNTAWLQWVKVSDKDGHVCFDFKDPEDLTPYIEPDLDPVNREKLMAVLRDYFSIGDSYTYELTRVKSAFDIGTMSLDDFKEWEEEDISCLCDYILRELRRGSEQDVAES